MTGDNLAVKHDGRVTRLTLDRPDRRNALALATMRELIEAVETLPGETELVVLGAEGPVFSAGHDLSEMVGATEDRHRLLFDVCTEMMLVLHRIPQPVVAKVQGPATAAGCQLVASCDLAVAADSAWFATPGVKIGLFCSTPMVPLTRAVGRKRAMEMLLTGDRIDSATAVEWGLVNRAVPDERLDAEVEDLVERILSSSRRVVGLGKEAFYSQVDETEEDAYRSMAEVMTGNAGLADAQEGMSAFLEKRPPTWPE
ncbi:MAG TPA: enoyl-CoA hydratase [Acidimicrobiia bacterium]|nr:enoyl-CoA hydratase [Acidimicrobiia bacterium]